MSEHISTERMHDLLDGFVEAAEVARAERHVLECAACREAYAGLWETIAELRALPKSASPPEDLWTGIAARVAGSSPEAPEGDSRVLEFPGAAATVRRRRSFSGVHLAAAAALAAVLSAGVTWRVMTGPTSAMGGAATPVSGVVSTLGPAAWASSPASGAYESAVEELQAILAEGEDVLAPETLVAIDASLRQIDDALAEVADALERDPSSELLARLRANHQRTKLRVLRQAAQAVRAAS